MTRARISSIVAAPLASPKNLPRLGQPEHGEPVVYAAADDAIRVAVMGFEEERLARRQCAKGGSAARPPEVDLIGTNGGEVPVPIAVSHADIGAHARIIARARTRKNEHRRCRSGT
jgi:hypothetical protein